jgi:methyl-accepting chemotaxis protein
MSHAYDRSRKLAYLRIDKDTRDLLHAFMPRLQEMIPGILDDFYAHVTGESHLAEMFRDRQHIEHAKQAQARHWERMFSGRFDDDYFQSVERIGQAHCRLGLEPGWYIGGYALVKQALIRLVLEEAAGGTFLGRGDKIAEASRLLQAIDKAITLDMDLSIFVYMAEMDRAFSGRLDRLADEFGDAITSITSELSRSAEQLHAQVGELESNLSSTGEQVTIASSGTEEASANLQATASATDQLTVSISDISRQVSDGAKVTVEAVGKTQEMNRSVAILQDAAEKVGGIVRLIDEIAAQTNLLALNATIEAARAGEAGRGFAVVAGEVKSLAQQTGRATGEISDQIGEIQAIARTVGGHIETLTGSIGGVESMSTAIAAALEEQSAVTHEISRSVGEAASGATSVSQAVSTVHMASQRSSSAAESVFGIAADVRAKAETLDRQSRAFIDRIRSAKAA